MTPHSICIDALHTLSLGVYQFFCSHIVWEILTANPWALVGPASTIHELGFARVREAYFKWCGDEIRAGRPLTKVQGLALGMFGSASEPEMRLRAAETNGFLRFCDALLRQHYNALDDTRRRRFRSGLDALLTIYDISRSHVRRVPPSTVQAFTDAARRHLQACGALGIRFRPKHHFLMHMGPRSSGAESRHRAPCSMCWGAQWNCDGGRGGGGGWAERGVVGKVGVSSLCCGRLLRSSWRSFAN